MPHYTVPVTAVCYVYVEAEDENEAMERACEEISYGDFGMDTGGPAEELKTPEDISSARRHADVKLDAV